MLIPVRGGDGLNLKGGGERWYRYFSQLGKLFYQGMRESLTISTYSISIVNIILIVNPPLKYKYNKPKYNVNKNLHFV